MAVRFTIKKLIRPHNTGKGNNNNNNNDDNNNNRSISPYLEPVICEIDFCFQYNTPGADQETTQQNLSDPLMGAVVQWS